MKVNFHKFCDKNKIIQKQISGMSAVFVYESWNLGMNSRIGFKNKS